MSKCTVAEPLEKQVQSSGSLTSHAETLRAIFTIFIIANKVHKDALATTSTLSAHIHHEKSKMRTSK